MTGEPLVTVLVLGYRRPEHLRRTILSFREANTYPRVELILADDGSPAEMQAAMRELPFDRFVMSRANTGLGANTNRGLDAARGDVVLQLQDDWLCRGPAGFLEEALAVMARWPDLGFIRLTDRQPALTYAVRRSTEGRAVRVYDFEQPVEHPFLYTDTPHLKSKAAIGRLGRYLESRHMARTELDMRDRFNAQRDVRAAFVEGLDVFEHIGDDASFNRPLPLARIGMAMDKVPGLRALAAAYRRAKSARGRRG